jgi:hypothetical protein
MNCTDCPDCLTMQYMRWGNTCERCWAFNRAWVTVQLLCENRGELSTAGLVV